MLIVGKVRKLRIVMGRYITNFDGKHCLEIMGNYVPLQTICVKMA